MSATTGRKQQLQRSAIGWVLGVVFAVTVIAVATSSGGWHAAFAVFGAIFWLIIVGGIYFAVRSRRREHSL